ncbi:predicted protein [Postia placenta Mad-698-R]|nr:predicted protein [Postia placenta Mad-698-R]
MIMHPPSARLLCLGWLPILLVPRVRASFTISPGGTTLQQCLPTDLIWTEEHLWAAPNAEDSPGDPTLHDFGIINSSFILWTVNLPVGQNVSFTYVQTANLYYIYSSAEYMVVPGQDDSCLTGSSSTGTSSVLPISVSSSASIISSSTSLIPSSTSITSGSTNTISSSASAISSSASASSDPSASKTPAVANADGNKPARNLAWVAGLVVGLAAVIIGVIAAFFITRPFLHAGTLPNNEMSQPRREGAGGLEVAAHLLGASPQIPEGHSAITPPPLSFDRGPFTSHDQSHDSLLHGGTSEKEGLSGETLSSFLKGLVGLTSNATAASEINISTSPSTSRDVDGGIAFSDDGVPDILPPDYEDRRPATIQVR